MSGVSPRIEDYLDFDSQSETAPPLSELLVQLVKIDLDYRWRSRQSPGRSTPKIRPLACPRCRRVLE